MTTPPAAPAPQSHAVEREAQPSPAARPSIIEVPGSANTPATPHLSVIFVLRNGTRISAWRYLLTSEFLSANVDGVERRFPLRELDLSATLATNRERGIEIRIPLDPNEIALGF